MTGIFRRTAVPRFAALVSASLVLATLGFAATVFAGASTGTAAPAPAARAAAPPAFLNWRFIYRGSDKVEFDTVSAVSQRDAWVAGDYFKGTKALILHWTGSQWRSVPVPDARGFMPLYSDDSSADDVWFVGYQITATGETPRALRWTGSDWRNQPLPAGAQGFLSLRVLRGNDAWLANTLSCPSDSPAAQKCSSLLWHWNGRSWRQYQLPVGISSIAGSAATNVWVSAYKGDGGKLNELRMHFYAYRWTGSAWRAAATPHPLSVGCLPEIDTTSPRDVWMTTCAERGAKRGLVLHWTGHSWRQIWNLTGFGPLIDGKLGVWLGPTLRWTPDGIGGAGLPLHNEGFSFPSVTRVPGTTTLLAVGETFTNASARGRTYMAIIGGPFGPYRPAPSGIETAGPAAQQKLVSPARTGVPSRW
jgi:hypothetical protein